MKIPLLEDKHTFFSHLSRCITTTSSVSSLHICTRRTASNFSPINNNKVKHFHRLKVIFRICSNSPLRLSLNLFLMQSWTKGISGLNNGHYRTASFITKSPTYPHYEKTIDRMAWFEALCYLFFATL